MFHTKITLFTGSQGLVWLTCLLVLPHCTNKCVASDGVAGVVGGAGNS